MKVNLLQKEDEKKWNEFVENHPKGRFVHLTSYKDVLEETYGYESRYLYIQEEGKILSLFPLFKFKKRFISQPFSEYGGILFDGNLSREEKEKILETWKEHFKNLLSKGEYLEIHGQLDEVDLLKSHFISEPLGKIAVLKLKSYQELYNNFDYQVKKAIQKAEREGVRVYEETNEESIKSKFYPLYAKYSKERHGSPPHGLDLFLNYYKFAPQNIRIYFAEINKVLVGALWGFLAGKRVYIAVNPCLEKYFIHRPDDLLHARFIEWASENNFEYFDFGPARYEGQVRYKRKWGVEFFDHFYLYFSKEPAKFKPLVPENRMIKVISWFWKHFMPLRLANKLGSTIRKKMIK